MKSADFKNVTLRSGFLHQKHLLNKKITLDAVYNRLVDTGRIAAFDFDGTVTPHFFWDSDVAKWMESAAYVLAENPNPDLQSKIEHLIDRFEEHQEKDGYFNLYFMQVNPNGRFTDRNMHELYCLGGFIEAAIAYYDATGRDRFLKCVIKYVDYVYKYIIEENRGAFKTPGHEEIELALVKLYYCTNNRKYLDMAAFFINNRGVCDDPPIEPERFTHYSDQSHLPVRRQETAEGHAVRACYLYSAMADLAFALGDEELKKACRQLFNDIISHKMYITGGIGSTRFYEGFTSAYDLPNERAYAETCAAISLIFFAQRMQLLDNDAVYADIIERELYNGFISGLSLSGDAFFYENPLEIDLENYTKYKPLVNGEQFAPYRRKKVFDCFCCPPNITRVLAILGSYIYSFDDDACYINQFTDSTVSQDGMEVTQTTDYPLDGTVNISLKNVKRLCIRIPSWCTKFKLSCGYRTEKGYAVIDNPDGEITIKFDMTPTLIEANPMVKADSGKAALQLGPVIYCAEGVDNGNILRGKFIDKNLQCRIQYNPEFGLNTITAKGFKKLFSDRLYAPFSEDFEKTEINLIPFSCFANRDECDMMVWLDVR